MSAIDKERQVFEDMIARDPFDRATRKVYADWLDEHDRPEQADENRRWGDAEEAALKNLVRFVYPYRDDPDEDDPYADPEPIDWKRVLDRAAFWGKEAEEGEEPCFDSNFAQDTLQDPKERERFWADIQLLTGHEAEDKVKAEEFYRCAC